MARKKAEKQDMSTAAEPKLKPVRLDLPAGAHRLLRMIAADEDMSMASYAREILVQLLQDEAKRRGIKE